MNLIPFKSALSVAIIDVPIYMYHLPEEVTKGILILHSMSGVKLTSELPGYKKGKFQVIVRIGNNFQDGYQTALSIIEAFKTVQNKTYDGVYIHFVEPLNDPIAFPKSKGSFIEFSLNFSTAYTEN